jgi:hypothetical protein
MKCTLAKRFVRLSGDPSGKRSGAIVRYSRVFSDTRAFLSSGFGELEIVVLRGNLLGDAPRASTEVICRVLTPLQIVLLPSKCFSRPYVHLQIWGLDRPSFSDRLPVGCILMARLLFTVVCNHDCNRPLGTRPFDLNSVPR